MASANMMMWGSVDEGKSIFADDRVRPAMEALAKKLYWAAPPRCRRSYP